MTSDNSTELKDWKIRALAAEEAFKALAALVSESPTVGFKQPWDIKFELSRHIRLASSGDADIDNAIQDRIRDLTNETLRV